MSKYKNVLQHLAGLLHLHMDPVPGPLVEEVVTLLHQAGVKDREQWLDLLEDCKASPAILAAIAKHALPFQNLRSFIMNPFSNPSRNSYSNPSSNPSSNHAESNPSSNPEINPAESNPADS